MNRLPQENPRNLFAQLQGAAIHEAKAYIPPSTDPDATRRRVAKRAAELLRKSLGERIRQAQQHAAGEHELSTKAWDARQEALATAETAERVLGSWPGRDPSTLTTIRQAKRTAEEALKEHGLHGQAAIHWREWARQLEELQAGVTPESTLTAALAAFVVAPVDERRGSENAIIT